MTPDALIFDLDGTLWDAAAASTAGWNQALEEMGLPFRVDVSGLRSVSGTPFAACVETLLPELCPASEAVLTALEAGERTMIELMGGELYPGVSAGLRRLAAAYPLFVVSNCPDWYLESFLAMTGLRSRFMAWDSHGASGLPKAEMLRGLCQRWRLQAPVYVGDTQGDRRAAETAGMRFVHVRYGFGRLDGPGTPDAVDDFGALVERYAERARGDRLKGNESRR